MHMELRSCCLPQVQIVGLLDFLIEEVGNIVHEVENTEADQALVCKNTDDCGMLYKARDLSALEIQNLA